MATSSGPAVVRSGLIFNVDSLNLRSYSGSGTTWTDNSGSNNNATLSNTSYSSSSFLMNQTRQSIKRGTFPVFANDTFGRQKITRGSFENETVNQASITSSINLGGSSPVGTLNAWIKLTNLNSYQQVIGWRNGTNYDFYFAVSGNGNTEARVRTATSSYDVVLSYTYFGTWTNICFTSSASTSYLYINGSQVGSNTSISGNWGASSSFSVGGTYPFNGYVSDIGVYNRALSASEAAQNFNALRGRYSI